MDFTPIISETDNASGNCSMPNPMLFLLPNLDRSFYNEFGLFYYYFKKLPNAIAENDVDVEAAHRWFLGHYSVLVVDELYIKSCFGGAKQAVKDDIIYFLSPDLIVYFDTQQSIIRYLFKETQTDFVEKVVAEMNAFKKKPSAEAEIYLLVQRHMGYGIEKFALNEQPFALEDNYNDDLFPIHKEILSRLNRKKDKGIVLLHGEPGTGKTSYIRHLTRLLEKKVIFLPPNMAEGITHPSFLPMLMENPDSILVIEDAENILLDRNYNDKSAVSALLNLSDGLLADCLNIQLICTFNTDITKIDSALLRKGRLIASYKFGPLACKKAQHLAKKLGQTSYISTPVHLTDVYNQNPIPGQTVPKKQIGFLTV